MTADKFNQSHGLSQFAAVKLPAANLPHGLLPKKIEPLPSILNRPGFTSKVSVSPGFTHYSNIPTFHSSRYTQYSILPAFPDLGRQE
jgi:hypothetical protein